MQKVHLYLAIWMEFSPGNLCPFVGMCVVGSNVDGAIKACSQNWLWKYKGEFWVFFIRDSSMFRFLKRELGRVKIREKVG